MFELVFIVTIVTASALILGGLCMKERADKRRDYAFGFRTERALADNDSWKLANGLCGKIWLICGAAACMKQCFGNYGELFRVGGDEFTALIFADEDRLTMIRMDFAEELEKWSAENDLDLSVSCGYVRVSEVPGLSFAEIAKLADDRMYENKDEYYQKKKAARRRD